MITRTTGRAKRKAKKSYTLSPETVSFLESMRVQRHAESVSSVLEEIVEEFRREHERAAIESATADYYSSLSEKELIEQSAWGDLSLLEFMKGERP